MFNTKPENNKKRNFQLEFKILNTLITGNVTDGSQLNI